MWSRIAAFFRRWWNGSDRPEPGSVVIQPPVTPVEPPEPVTPPVTPDPPAVVVVPPVTPPVIERPNPCAGSLHIFCESFDGTRCDTQIAKIGWPVDKTYIHVWDTGVGQPKWSNKGRRVLNIKNPNDKGSNLWDHQPADWRAAITGLVGRARAAGAIISVDSENWLIQVGPAFHEFLYQSAKAAHLLMFNVPKIGLEHFMQNKEDDGWAWAGPTTRPGRLGWLPEQVCEFWNRNSDLDVAWYYGTSVNAFFNASTSLSALGYTVPSVPMMDGAGSEKYGQRIPDAAAAAMVVPLWLRYGCIGIFNPHNLGPQFVAALRSVRP